MIVPQYWAEGRVQHRDKNRQITVRRFGWSDNSQAEAQAGADLRAAEALGRLISGEKLARREPKIPYNGAEGVPIREEIIQRLGNTIITRNSYGARCLNTPNVFFADIDFQRDTPFGLTLGVVFVLLLAVALVGWQLESRLAVFAFGVGAIFLGVSLAGHLHRAIRRVRGGEEKEALGRIAGFLAPRPEWSVRLYRTPAGMRVLAMHRLFDPGEPEVAESFKALGADPMYALMCLNQQCFRARVSAKPWRIGIGDHLRPRPGVWPVKPERLPLRRAWVERYEAAAQSFAACTFLESAGSGAIHAEARFVQELHDELCRATRRLPMA